MEPEYDIENPRERRRSRARSARKRRRDGRRNREDAALAAAAAGQALAAKEGETDIPMLIVYIIGGIIVVLTIVLIVGVLTKKDSPKRKPNNNSGRYANIQNRGPGSTVVEDSQPKKGLDLSGPAWAIGGAVTALGVVAASGKKTAAGSLAGNGTCSNGDPTMADKLEGMFSNETKSAHGVGVLDWFTWIFWLIGLFGLYKIGDACIDGRKPCGDDNDKAEGCTKWVGKVLGCFLLLTIGGLAAGGFLYIMMELFNPGGFQWEKVRPEYCTYDKIMHGDGIEADNSELNAMGRGVACAAITRSRGVMAWSSTMDEMYKDGQDLSFKHGGGYVGSGLFSALVSPEWLITKLIYLPMWIFWYPLTKANESNGTNVMTSVGVRLGLLDKDSDTIKNLQEDSKKWFYWVPGLSHVFGREYKEPWYKRFGYSMMGSVLTWGASFLFAAILYCLFPFFWKCLASYIPDTAGLKHVKALAINPWPRAAQV